MHAHLRAAVGARAATVDALYRELPATTRAELSYGDFVAVIDRLLAARLAAVGPEGVRLRVGARPRGFRLALRSPSLVPTLLRVDPIPAPQPSTVGIPAGTLADGYPRSSSPMLTKGSPATA